MYFTDTSELQKFEHEMKQVPNFDRENSQERNNVQKTDKKERRKIHEKHKKSN